MSDSDNAKRLFFEALDCMDAGQFEDAERRLREALTLAPANVSILTNLAVVLRQQGKRGEARESAEKALAVNADNLEALLVLADARLHERNFGAALAAYDRIVALDPGIAQVHNNRGIALENAGRLDDALASYERAIALAPDFADAHVNRGSALRQRKRHDEAIAAYDQALALDPALPHAWLGRGNALGDLKQYEEALVAYDNAVALDPALPHAWLGRGNVFGRLKRHEGALAAYDRALALDPEFAEAWLGRGNTLCELRRYQEALAPFDKALALKPEFGEAWLGRGNVFHDLKRYDDALAAYDQALAVNPGLAGAWLGRGNVLRWSKRTPEAIDAYRQALKLGGDAASIAYCLAALGAEELPAAPPEHYVAELFDAYADNFDHDLVDNLKYDIPAVLADTIPRYTSSDALDILDLGCGTGLMGVQIRSIARSLTGIDVSANMIEKARQRQIYDELICGDAAKMLQTQDREFDLALAADVFIYLGDLAPVFRAVRAKLRDGGLFGFTVEAIDQSDFVLRSTLRYAHSLGYLRRIAQEHRFAVETIEPQVIRRDAGADVGGYLAVLRAR